MRVGQRAVDAAAARRGSLGRAWSEGDEPDSLPPSDKQLADHMVDRGLLNAWQAKQLLDGQTRFRLGPYRIIDSLGQGGMGQVFKAQHDKMGRTVAIKVLPRDKCTPQAIANFPREIRAMASLDHPKLVGALDAGEDGNVHYLVTEFMPGLDLRKLVRQDGPLDMATAASIICQVAEGLAYAHAQGIVHRDVKPGNVLVSPEGEAKLSDLGLSGPLASHAEDDPRQGKIAGTADYLSPDQIRNPWSPAPAWDIYSLGCTLYYAVTGKVPFPGGTTADKARAHCELRPLDPRRLNPSLSPEFVDVTADMMAKEPADRISSARDVVARLAPFVRRHMILPPPIAVNPVVLPLEAAPSDTEDDIVPAVPAGSRASSGFGSEAIELGSPGNDEELNDSASLEMHEATGVMAVLWPLTVFVLAPLALVGATLLLYLVVRAML